MLNPANRTRLRNLGKNLRLPQKEAEKVYEDLLPTVERKPIRPWQPS